MKKFTKRFLVITSLLAALPSLAFGAPTLEALLQQAKIQAVKTNNGLYKIPVEVGGDTVMVFAEEERLGSTDIKLVNLYALVLQLPANYKIPQPMLQKMVDLNNGISYGKLYREGDYIFYKSSFLLRTADPDSLEIELELAHILRQTLKKELQPFLAQQ